MPTKASEPTSARRDHVADGSPAEEVGPSKEDVLAALQVEAAQLREAGELLRKRRLLREANLQPVRPGEDALKKLDSSVKRNAALVKKLRAVSEDTKDALLEDIKRTNLSKYVSEAKSAIVDASLKLKDINAALQVISLLHQNYAEFGPQLASALTHNLLSGTTVDGEKASMARRRSWLRLLAELQALGIASEPSQLQKPLVALSGALADGGRDKEAAHSAASILAAYAKAAREEFLGLPAQLPHVTPGSPAALAEGVDEEQLRQRVSELREVLCQEQAARFHPPAPLQAELRQVMNEAFDGVAAALHAEHAALLEMEQQQRRDTRRQLSEEAAAAYEAQRRGFDALEKSAASLAESLGRELPHLEAEGTTRLQPVGSVAVVSGKETAGAGGLFEDEETRTFYESLPDLASLVPALLLGKGQEAKPESGSPEEPSSPVESSAAPAPLPGDAGAERAQVFQQISAVDSREAADEAAVAFCFVGGKAARKRLVRMLTLESTAAIHQLPFHARILATLAAVFPDVGAQALQHLEADFTRLQAKKDSSQRTLDERLRNAHLLAELTKFRVCPPATFFLLLKELLDDFWGHSVDAAGAMVEASGRFLLLQQESQQRMSNMLEVMMRLKNTRNLDSRQSLAVDVAYLACKPRSRAERQKDRPPHILYMRHLVHDSLTQDNVKQITRKLRKFAWAEAEAPFVRCLLSGLKARYADAPLLASLAAALARYRPSLGVALPDALMEEVRLSLESPESGDYQRQVGHLRLLGELYNYRLVDSRTIFDTLYLLLAWGHETPERAARYDPPLAYFRARLVCVLLATCGHYFSKGAAAHRLDRFLAYFQRYLLHKPPLPLDVDFDVQELFEQLRPNRTRAVSFEEACAEVEALEAAEGSGPATPEDSEHGDESGAESASDDEREVAEEAPAAEEETHLPLGDDEEEAVVRVRPPRRHQEVDEEFEKELAALSLAPPRAAAAIPGAGAPVQTAESTSDTVAFKVMLRRGGKDDKTRAIQVPAGLALAVRSREELAAESAERAEMKRLVLEASRREDEAAAAATAAAAAKQRKGGRPGARNRGVKYTLSQLPALLEDT